MASFLEVDAYAEVIETDAPGQSQDHILLSSESFDDLSYAVQNESNGKALPSGSIHALTQRNIHLNRSGDEIANNDHSDFKDICDTEMLVENITNCHIEETATQNLFSDLHHVDTSQTGYKDEDVNSSEWRNHKKHVFILSESGKPIYSRYGREDRLATIMGVMVALVSFVQDSNDSLRSIIAGQHKFVFLVSEHVILVGVTHGMDSTQQIFLQLVYIYNQLISVLTHTAICRVFKQRQNYDLRHLLFGVEKLFDNLLNLMDVELGFLLAAVRCLPLDRQVRSIVAQSIVQHGKIKDLAFAIIIAKNQLVALVQIKNYYLHPMDLHLIINLVNASESFKIAESWTPICLPKLDASGYLQAHVSYLDSECEVCMLLLTADRDSFFILSEARDKIRDRLIRYNALEAINRSIDRHNYSIRQCSIPDLRHFLYKVRSTAQYTSPEMEAPYSITEEQQRIFDLYRYIHHRIHTSGRPLKLLFHVGQYESILGWVSQEFEVYVIFGPLITKADAIQSVHKLLQWIKREEDRLFILHSVKF